MLLRDHPVGAHGTGEFIERGLERSQTGEVTRGDADRRILLRFFDVAEPEEFVFDHAATETAAVLLAVEVRLGRRETRARRVIRTPAEDETTAVKLIAAALADDVDRAGRAEARRGISRRDRDLKLLNAFLRDIDRS